MQKLEIITDARCIVCESPVYDEKNDILYTVDIQGKRLRKIYLSRGKIEDTVLCQQVGFVVLGIKGEVIVGAEDGVYLLVDGGSFKKINKPFNMKGIRFNDGKVGPDGNLYLGTFSRDFSAAFYKMDGFGNMTELFDHVGNSNGLDWSLDGKKMYYNDTPTHKTFSFDFDIKNGLLSNKQTVFEYGNGNPDGLSVDENGDIWSAVWGKGEVVCIRPETGELIDCIKLPVSQATSCAFYGKYLDSLAITTAAHGIMLKDEELAGSVFGLKMRVKGKKNYRLALKN